MIRTSPETNELNEAFARAQGKFDAAVKANVNPAFKSRYADISSIIDATLEHLNSEGIGVKQHPSLEYKQVGDGVEAFMTVTTRLTYKGQWEESDISIPAVQRDRFDAQSCGSALTYASRYALQGIFVVRREDDDANAATGRGTHEAAQEVAKQKIAALKETVAQREAPVEGTLFYTYPERHQGHLAEWINIREYTSKLPPNEGENLRTLFKPYLSKTHAKNGSILVPRENMQPLLEVLAGGSQIKIHELKPNE